VLLNFGLQSVPSGRAALIFASFPLLTMLVAATLRRERMSVRTTAGVLVTIAGVAVAMTEKLFVQGRGNWTGEVAVLLSALCGAVCSVLYRPYLERYPALAVSTFAMFASVLFLAPFAATEGLFREGVRLRAAGWGTVLFIGLSSGAGYFLWLWALAHASASRVTAFLSLSPVTAALLGAWLLREPLGGSTITGTVAVAAGLWIVGASPHTQERPSHESVT